MLLDAGRTAEAAELCRDLLETRRATLVLPAMVFASTTLADLSVRVGDYSAARRALDEALPAARRTEATMFVVPALTVEAELEAARGNTSVARLALEEAADRVVPTRQVVFAYRWLCVAGRLGVESAPSMFERLRALDGHKAFRAQLLEAEAIMAGAPELYRAAAEAYAALDLPYQASRCLTAAAAGEDDLGVEPTRS